MPFARLDARAAIDALEDLHDADAPALAAHANVHTVNLACADPAYREVLRRADVVLNDGKGVMLGARLLGSSFPADLNGNFVTPLLLQRAADKGWPTFFFGAKPGVADRAATLLQGRYTGLKVVGTRNGYFSSGEEGEISEQIRSSGATLLLAGMGNPMQERWLDRHLAATGVRLGVGVGAFFDFQTGEIQRAPGWMNRAGVEWVHRLFKEPKRMWRRYLIGNPQFLLRVLASRVRSR